MIIIKGLDGKDKGEVRQDSSRKKILPFEFVVLEACLEAVISSLENEVCALYSLNLFFFFFEINFSLNLFLIGEFAEKMYSYSLAIFKTQCNINDYIFNIHLVV